ncbi:MAG: flagellar basal body P-ring formation chaperone FlgA [Nitrospinota bacterium]
MSGKRTLTAALVLSLVLLLALGSTVSGEVRVRVRERSEVIEDVVTLGHIADLWGSDHLLLKRLRKLELVVAPPPGASSLIPGELISFRLEEEAPGKVKLISPAQVRVHRSFRRLEDKEVRRLVESYIEERLGPRGHRFEVKSITFVNNLLLPPGELTPEVRPAPGATFVGKTPLALIFRQGDKEVRRLWVTADIAVFAPVVVLAEPLRRNQEIREGAIELQERNLAELPRGAFTSPEQALGARARRLLGPGEVLTEAKVERPPIVRPGDMVKVVLRVRGLLITTLGRALQKGRKGELIQIQNTRSLKKLFGRVVDRQTVEVLF